jgi:hypothetical protein
MLFGKRTPMQKFQSDLDKLVTRRDALVAKQAGAQAALDRALEARQRHMIEGDISDDATAAKRQAAVDSATSALAGFALALTRMADDIGQVETALDTAKQEVARETGAKKLQEEVDAVELMLGPWLELTRTFAATFATLGDQHHEGALITAYLRNAASEIEAATTVSTNELYGRVNQIRDGSFAIPKPPNVPVAIVPIAAPPKPPTQQVFLLHPATWREADGTQRISAKWVDVDLPIAAAEFALLAEIGIDPADPITRQGRGKAGRFPESSWLNDLDNRIGPNIPDHLRNMSAEVVMPKQTKSGQRVPYQIMHHEAR